MSGASDAVEVIDAHQHIWSLERADYAWMDPSDPVLHRDYTIADAEAQLAAAGIAGTVLVQSADNVEDSKLMFDAARASDRVLGVVAWIPLDDAMEAERLLETWSKEAAFCGVRSLIHTREDATWLASTAVAPTLRLLADRGLPLDVVAVDPGHLRAMTEVGERHPELSMVIDHLGHPPVKAADDGAWSTLMAEAAANPRVHAKISGLYPIDGPMGRWDVEDVAPFVERALEQFGAGRLMYGGDWPIAELAGGYGRVWGALSTLFEKLDPPARSRVCAGTARDFYGLPSARIDRDKA
ncbi:MAG: amidohydrolase family protein [Microbacterium sp.]